MDQIIVQILNGLDKGSAYALIALGLTLIFGTLGVVNFAHGALFMLGSFCAVIMSRILSASHKVAVPGETDFLGNQLMRDQPYVYDWFGEAAGATIVDWAVPISILFAIPVMIGVGQLQILDGMLVFTVPHIDGQYRQGVLRRCSPLLYLF